MTVTDPVALLGEHLRDDMEQVNALIRRHMQSQNAPRIPEVTAHLIEAGGKRIRPLLNLAAARLLGYEGNAHLGLAATVEFIHTATLLHDDVVDESTQRRGRPTANLLWDNKSSVLVGDFLFARSFLMMVESGSMEALRIMAESATALAEGEILQMGAAQNLATDEATYLRIIRYKTAALFSAATESGAVIAGATPAQRRALAEFGDALGICYQLVDDYLDYAGSAPSLGKKVGTDFAGGKVTLPVILAHAAGSEQERAFWKRCIEKGERGNDELEHAMALLHRQGALQATRERAQEWSDRARAALAELPAHRLRDLLDDLTVMLVTRIN
ncbi:MAG: polyprenyl synthetase family protein [Pararhodobacter sp.]|nr:polyprenyl synthetase family protein [Pararhodobacter sp.]